MAHNTPYIELDLEKLQKRYNEFAQNFAEYKLYYAMKANPHPEILKFLIKAGTYFDTASIGEIKQVLACGATADKISYGNTIKKETDIAEAFRRGVRLFAVDSVKELEKIARAAPKSSVFCRILVACEGAQWPLSRKFGCSVTQAIDILLAAKTLGLKARGVSLHVGSQQLNIKCWDEAIKAASEVFSELLKHGVELDLLNLGGGFPITYIEEVITLKEISQAIKSAIAKYFGARELNVIIEPGRGLVGDCGVMCCEVVLIARKQASDEYRWLYLDAGKFNGLIETLDESIRYRIVVPNRYGVLEKFIIAGPSCDSADVLYEKQPYALPGDIQIGDKVYIYGTGAYCSTYASVNFNGFEPIKTYIKSF